ncbi:unnamed protein product [Vicia faba]|uniref:F-box domain-containing protein n=1 Tax=Vicia faba TaxID=3906 RepID=A0AAV1A5I7_VICFA|nr:unnamed protein product [Vicia faba]
MPRMDNCKDFLSWVDPDTSLNIFKCLDDPADLARVSCVSRSWRGFVVANGLSKQLCLRISCLSPVAMDCIDKAISASSTDNFPQESIVNTLEERDNIAGRFSYWSSSGQSNPNVPETLTYQLASQICVITEINIQPFQAHFQMGSPIYSAKSVRFKMGHLKASLDDLTDAFVWTYTSPEFPMAQKFKLPEPVLCIGGILQIELLERVQSQEMDGLLYICISHVQALGIQLSPAFSVDILGPSGMFVLKRDRMANCQPPEPSENESGAALTLADRDFQQIVTILRGHVMGVGAMDGWEEEEYEVDEDNAF